jgi:hypothetical protein
MVQGILYLAMFFGCAAAVGAGWMFGQWFMGRVITAYTNIRRWLVWTVVNSWPVQKIRQLSYRRKYGDGGLG